MHIVLIQGSETLLKLGWQTAEERIVCIQIWSAIAELD